MSRLNISKWREKTHIVRKKFEKQMQEKTFSLQKKIEKRMRERYLSRQKGFERGQYTSVF